MRIALVVLSFFLAPYALACPELRGPPAADLKAALDFYPSIAASEVIDGADCAMQHFETARRKDLAYRNEQGSRHYRYGRLLGEIADIQHRAARRVRNTGGGDGARYFGNEIEVRTALLGWCLEDRTACDVYRQLGALANAYEAARQAPDLHDWMVSNSPESLAVGAALKVWLRGVYSCPAWDFHPPVQGALLEWRETCSPSCIAVAKDASRILKEHGPRISSLKDQVQALVESVEACEFPGD